MEAASQRGALLAERRGVANKMQKERNSKGERERMYERTCDDCERKFSTDRQWRYSCNSCRRKTKIKQTISTIFVIAFFLAFIAGFVGFVHFMSAPEDDNDCSKEAIATGTVMCEKVCGTRTTWYGLYEQKYCHWDDVHSKGGK